MVQTQPKFIANRDIFEKREKKAKLYSWVVFCVAEIVAELPYLLICAGLFWACWYVHLVALSALSIANLVQVRYRWSGLVSWSCWARILGYVFLRDALHWNW